jgi:hypothetical protein
VNVALGAMLAGVRPLGSPLGSGVEITGDQLGESDSATGKAAG